MHDEHEGPSLQPDAEGADATWFEQWYAERHHHLRRWCERRLGDAGAAEDIAQEALSRAWVRRASFPTPEDMAAWVWHVARNLCVDTLRRRDRLWLAGEVPERPNPESDPVWSIIQEDDRRTVHRALDAIPVRHKEVLRLHHLEDEAYEAMAGRMGLTPGGVRALLFRARRSLRDTLVAREAIAVAGICIAAARAMWGSLHRSATAMGSQAPQKMEMAALGFALLAASTLAPGDTQDIQPTMRDTPTSPVVAVTPQPDLDPPFVASEDLPSDLPPAGDAQMNPDPAMTDPEIPSTPGWRSRVGIGDPEGPLSAEIELFWDAGVPPILQDLLPCLDLGLLGGPRTAEGADTQGDDDAACSEDATDNAE